MRVAVDTNGLYTTQAGIARYIDGLIRGLSKMNASDLEIFQLAWPVQNLAYHQPVRMMKTLYRELFWLKYISTYVLWRRAADLVHSTGAFRIGHPRGVRLVATVHDLAVIRDPKRFRPWMRWMTTRFLRTIDKADRIICISRFTADEVMRELGIPGRKIDVVYHGSDFENTTAGRIERPPDVDLPNAFFLFVGSLEPGKNAALLVRAYRLAEAKGVELPPLCLVGARWGGVAREISPPSSWIYLGYQPDEVLAYLYRRALALVFPSKYEGFGFPVLEAMSLGCPVLCSRLASIPEVGGEAVRYCEQEPESYLEAMTEMVNAPELRQQYARAGAQQAKKFSWSACAEATTDVYRKALRT